MTDGYSSWASTLDSTTGEDCLNVFCISATESVWCINSRISSRAAFAALILATSPLPETAQFVGHAGFLLLIPAYYTAAAAQLFATSLLGSLARVTLASAIAGVLSLLVMGLFLAVNA